MKPKMIPQEGGCSLIIMAYTRKLTSGKGIVFWPPCPEQGHFNFKIVCPKQGVNLS